MSLPGLRPPRLHIVPGLRRPGGWFLPGWLAITIGGQTWAWRRLEPAELAHEACHVAQWQRYGARFIPRYLRASWRAWRAGGDAYRDNAFEVAARRTARAAAPAGAPPQPRSRWTV